MFFRFPLPGIDSTVRRKLVKAIYDLAWPVLVAQLAVIAYSVIDTMMAGRTRPTILPLSASVRRSTSACLSR